MKQKRFWAVLLLGTALLTGCSDSLDTVTVNTLTVERDGTIADIAVEDFSDGNYDMTKLENFINAEVEDYNTQAGEGSISLDKLETESEIVKLQLRYADMEDYNAFNHTEYELTDFDASELSGSFTSVADGSQIQPGDMDETGMKVLQVQDAMNIVCKGKILYYNSYVTESNGIFTASGDGTAVIIFR